MSQLVFYYRITADYKTKNRDFGHVAGAVTQRRDIRIL